MNKEARIELYIIICLVILSLMVAFAIAFATNFLLYPFFTDYATSTLMTFNGADCTKLFEFHKSATSGLITFYETGLWEGDYSATTSLKLYMTGSNNDFSGFCLSNAWTPITLDKSWNLGDYWWFMNIGTSTYLVLLEHNATDTWSADWTQTSFPIPPTYQLPQEPTIIRSVLGDKIPFFYIFSLLDTVKSLSASTTSTTFQTISLTFPTTTYASTTILSSMKIDFLNRDKIYELVPPATWDTIKGYFSAFIVISTMFAIYAIFKNSDIFST